MIFFVIIYTGETPVNTGILRRYQHKRDLFGLALFKKLLGLVKTTIYLSLANLFTEGFIF